MTFTDFCGRGGKRAAGIYLLLWAVSTGYLAVKGADWVFPIISLILFGIILSAVGWWLTRRSDAPAVAVSGPGRQTIWFIAYIALYAFLLAGYGLGAVKQAVADGPAQEWAVLAYKLLIHVLMPAGLIAWLGGSLSDSFDLGLRRRGVVVALFLFCGLMFLLIALVSPSLALLATAGVTGASILPWALASWLWMSAEAGLCEEYLFRAGLQSRLTAWLQSPLAGILISCTLFGLVHWPGLYLRGGPGTDGWSTDPVQVAAFTIATLSPFGILFGTLWVRTRSLLLIVLIHGAVDALPHASEMIAIFR